MELYTHNTLEQDNIYTQPNLAAKSSAEINTLGTSNSQIVFLTLLFDSLVLDPRVPLGRTGYTELAFTVPPSAGAYHNNRIDVAEDVATTDLLNIRFDGFDLSVFRRRDVYRPGLRRQLGTNDCTSSVDISRIQYKAMHWRCNNSV
jgi:hypothetical protein